MAQFDQYGFYLSRQKGRCACIFLHATKVQVSNRSKRLTFQIKSGYNSRFRQVTWVWVSLWLFLMQNANLKCWVPLQFKEIHFYLSMDTHMFETRSVLKPAGVMYYDC